MQNVSSSNSQAVNVPKLRFPGFSSAYRTVRLGDISEKVSRTDPSSEAPIMMISAASGFINQSEKYSRDNAGQSLKKYTVLKQGELAYNHGASKLREFGCCFELEEYEARIPYVYHSFSVQSENRSYIAMLLNNPIIDRQLKRLVSSSVRMDGLLNISFDEYMSVILQIPNIEEQTHIVKLFNLLNDRITKQQVLVDNLKLYKRGVSEAIFSKKINFRCSNISWNLYTMEDLGYFYNGLSGKGKEDFGKGNSKFITYMNVYKNPISEIAMCEVVNVAENEKQNKVQYGDVLFSQSSETLEDVGMSSVWLHETTPYLNSFCFGFRFHNSQNVYPLYIAYYMRSQEIRRGIMREGQGATRINLSAERMKGLQLALPNIELQKKIGDFLFGLDKQINKAEAILNKTLELRKSLLQKMFI